MKVYLAKKLLELEIGPGQFWTRLMFSKQRDWQKRLAKKFEADLDWNFLGESTESGSLIGKKINTEWR